MTTAAQPRTAYYAEDGTSTSFPIPHPCRNDAEIRVERMLADGTRQPLAMGTHFTVSSAGRLNMLVAGPVGATLSIWTGTVRGARGVDIGAHVRRAGTVPSWSPTRRELTSISTVVFAMLLTNRASALPLDTKRNPGGSVMAIGSKTAAASLLIPAGTNMAQTSGYAPDSSIGKALYLSDEHATEALLAAFPRASFRSANGRIFRLVPDDQGYITPEQLGCPASLPGVNAQPCWQAAADYAHAMRRQGVTGIAATQSTYEMWVPPRNADQSAHLNWWERWDATPGDGTGIPFIAYSRLGMKAAPDGTRWIRRRGDGSDPLLWDDGWQSVPWTTRGDSPQTLPLYWRGGMVLLWGHDERPADPDDLAGIDWSGRWVLDGGIPMSDLPGWHMVNNEPQLIDGRGWDMSDKGLWWHQDRHTGDMTFDHLEVRGFRGELLYQGGNHSGAIFGKQLVLDGSDGDAFNPGPHGLAADGTPGRFEIDDLVIRNSFQALEGGTGPGLSRIGRLRVEGCVRTSALQGASVDPLVAQAGSGRLVIDRFEGIDSGLFSVSWRTTVNDIQVTDMGVSIGWGYGAAWDCAIRRITATTNRKVATVALTNWWLGEADKHIATYNCTIGPIIHRLGPEARRSGLRPGTGLEVLSDYAWGTNVRVAGVFGEFTRPPMIGGKSAQPGQLPAIEQLAPTAPDGDNAGAASQIVDVATAVWTDIRAYEVWLDCSQGKEGLADIPATRFQQGSRLRLRNISSRPIRLGSVNLQYPARYTLAPGETHDFIYARNRWVPQQPAS